MVLQPLKWVKHCDQVQAVAGIEWHCGVLLKLHPSKVIPITKCLASSLLKKEATYWNTSNIERTLQFTFNRKWWTEPSDILHSRRTAGAEKCAILCCIQSWNESQKSLPIKWHFLVVKKDLKQKSDTLRATRDSEYKWRRCKKQSREKHKSEARITTEDGWDRKGVTNQWLRLASCP